MSSQSSSQGAPGFRFPSGPLSDEGMHQPGPSNAPDPAHLASQLPTSSRGLTKDGQPAKRRGPKPDSKPATSKRQAMNRAAQRNHRERKENYIKSLEEEVLRVKGLYVDTVQQRDDIAKENGRLRDLLKQHGIRYDQLIAASTASPNMTRGGSVSGSYVTGSEGTGFTPDTTISAASQHAHGHPQQQQMLQSPQSRQMLTMPKRNIDYDQLGIDFVLEYEPTQSSASDGASRSRWRPPYPSPPPHGGLERTCMGHSQFLEVRAYNPKGQVHHHPLENPDDHDHEHMSGHALMGTSIPLHHIMHSPAEAYPFEMPKITNEGLVNLLNLSAKLPMDRDGEMTPVMGWSWIFQQDFAAQLTVADFKTITATLGAKVRCYGFGAVFEEFELQNITESILANKAMPQLEAGLARQDLLMAA